MLPNIKKIGVKIGQFNLFYMQSLLIPNKTERKIMRVRQCGTSKNARNSCPDGLFNAFQLKCSLLQKQRVGVLLPGSLCSYVYAPAKQHANYISVHFYSQMIILKSYSADNLFELLPYSNFRMRFSTKSSSNYYSILGIERTASAAEIKKAYFVAAKRYHPDHNPNDVNAKAKFQEVSKAYTTLSDPIKKKEYDRIGHDQYQKHSQSYPASQPDPEEVFRQVFDELGLREVKEYFVVVQKDAGNAMEKLKGGEFSELFEFAKSHHKLMVGLMVPLIAVLRHPVLVGAALRIMIPAFLTLLEQPVIRGALTTWMYQKWKNLTTSENKEKKKK